MNHADTQTRRTSSIDSRTSVPPCLRGCQDVAKDLLARVGGLQLRARQLATGVAGGLHRSAYRGFSQEFVEHRDYTPGDEPRYVDWKLFGRTDRLVVRQYQQDKSLRVILGVDTSESMAFRSAACPISKYEAACALLAAVSYIAINQQDAVGLALLGDGLQRLIEPGARPGHWNTLTRVLADGRPAGPGDIAGGLRQLSDRLSRPALIVLASDLLGPAEPILQNLAWMSRGGRELMVLHVMDPAELYLGADGPCRFEDMESDARLDADPLAVRRSYRRQVDAFLARVWSTCASLRSDYQLFDTGKPLHPPLASILARRSARAY
jgi:uncharacterized protein (DUF58 family)